MKAVRLHGYGGVDQLVYEDVETPEPKPDEVLVKVAATSVNPIDWKIRSGAAKAYMPLSLPAILGRDVAGTVVKVGPNVRNPELGQRVMGLVSQSYAEYLVARPEHLTVIPDGLELEPCAALPLVVTTGAQLIHHMQLRPGAVVLVTGAVGSVGRVAVYSARATGAHVIAGVRASQKAEAKSLGAEQVVAVDTQSEIGALPELDAIADTVGHEMIERLVSKLKDGGVLGSVFTKLPSLEGKTIRVETMMARPDASLLRQMADAVRDGKLVIPIARRMGLNEAAEAQEIAEAGSAGGKILLLP
ncbi:MAG: NADP-dependent oxidoreductase [Bryobacteraceae bacterium]